MIKAVLFDFDGTVMNTRDIIIGSWQHVFMTIEGREHPVEEIEKTFGEVLVDSMARVFPDRDPMECVKIYRQWQTDRIKEAVKPFDGMKELVLALYERKIKMAVVTSRTRISLVDALEANDMLEYFDVLVSCDDTTSHKPDPEPANIAMEKLGVSPDECIMIGDSAFDIGCAHNAGIKAVLVSWSVSIDEEGIKKAAPEYIIDRAEELLELC